MTPTFPGTVSPDAKLLLDNKPEFTAHLHTLNGKRVNVSVEKQTRRRTNNQNRYLWGVVYKLIADHTGADPEEVHFALKYQFSPKRFIGNLVAPSTTKNLDTVDFNLYIEKVRRWAAEELSIVIPDPNEVKI